MTVFYLRDAEFDSALILVRELMEQSEAVKVDAVACCLEWIGITETEEGGREGALEYLTDLIADHPDTLADLVGSTLVCMEDFYRFRGDTNGDGHTDGSGTSPIGVTVEVSE